MAGVPRLPNLRESSHILFKVLTKLSGKYGRYDALISGLKSYIDGVGDTLDVKVTTLVGNSDPSNIKGQAQLFLDTFFGGMDMSARKAYFKEKYFGSDRDYVSLLDNIKRLDDGLRLRLKYNATFIIIGLTNKNDQGVSDGLYHITLSRDSTFDVAGQHDVPTGSPITTSIHLTDETSKIHYFFDYPTLNPLNPSAVALSSSLLPTPSVPAASHLSRAAVQQSMAASSEEYNGPAYPAPKSGETLADYVKRLSSGYPPREILNIRKFATSIGLKGGRTIRRKKSKQTKRKGTAKKGGRR